MLCCFKTVPYIHAGGPELFPEDGKPDTTKLIVSFHSSANAPEHYIMCLWSAGQILRFLLVEKKYGFERKGGAGDWGSPWHRNGYCPAVIKERPQGKTDT